MTAPAFPIERLLVPPSPPELPADMTRVSQVLSKGLPETIDLGSAASLIVLVPTGLATAWRDADPEAVVSSSDAETAPYTPDPATPVGDATRAAVRVLLLVGGAPVASVPLIAGLRRRLPDSGDPDRGVRVELAISSWRICAGSVRGPGDFGSRLEFSWRVADTAVDEFGPQPVPPRVVARLKRRYRMESVLGVRRTAKRPRRRGLKR
jgi:hypothetical protein